MLLCTQAIVCITSYIAHRGASVHQALAPIRLGENKSRHAVEIGHDSNTETDDPHRSAPLHSQAWQIDLHVLLEKSKCEERIRRWHGGLVHSRLWYYRGSEPPDRQA